MALRPIIYFGDNRLITPSKQVTAFDHALSVLIDDMFETMYASQGIGLAAPQIGINKQVAVIDVSEDRSQPLCFINPQLTFGQESVSMTEGCLSIPGVFEDVIRPVAVQTLSFDRMGKPFKLRADDLLARCIQHEYDHLHGKLFIDYLSPAKRQRALRTYLKHKSRAK